MSIFGGSEPSSGPENEGTAQDRVARALRLGPEYSAWVAELGAIEPVAAAPTLPDAERAAELLDRLGCPPAAIRDVVSTLPLPERDTERWWLLERCYARLVRGLGQPGAERGSWPQLPRVLGPAGESFYLHVFLATLPATLAWHEEHGVPDKISWATFADLGRHVRIHEATTGCTGIDEPWWMTLHLRGILFEIGRLQYSYFRLGIGPEHPQPWYDPSTSAALGPGFRSGDPSLGVHIASGAPLTPDACEESMREARTFFETTFPVEGRRVATCSSWLLDDQLAALLPPTSNIVRFQRSFELVPGWGDGDDGVLTFVFRSSGPLDSLVPSTSLQHGVIEHLRGGGHFRWRSGWRDLPESA